jgi:hypothetical protein
MSSLTASAAEKEIIKAMRALKDRYKFSETVDGDFCPGNLIRSQVLITYMVRIGKALGITIPDNIYIFHEQRGQIKLSVKEAALKLIKFAKHGN